MQCDVHQPLHTPLDGIVLLPFVDGREEASLRLSSAECQYWDERGLFNTVTVAGTESVKQRPSLREGPGDETQFRLFCFSSWFNT